MELKKELIDFISWYDNLGRDMFPDENYVVIVHEYLKSINSNESDELRAVGNNEQTKEVCDFCSNPVTNYKTNTCDKCSVLRRL